MNEKRKPVETEADLGSPASRTRSDIAPKEARSGSAPRFDSGFRPAVHIPAAPATPVDLEGNDLLEEGWDDPDADDSGETLLDNMHASVPPELVAQVRAISDPIGELDEPGHDHPADEFPTRETPMALEAALRAVSSPASTPKLPEVTSQMPTAPPAARLDEILAAQPASQPSVPVSIAMRPAPPAPPPEQAERAFLLSRVLPSDPPPARLILVAVLSFFGTLVLAAFVAWVVYLARH